MDDAMQWGIDVNAARYINATRETLNGDGDVAAEEMQHIYTDLGCTLQVHQPQRWDANIHRIVAALESQLGCLIGCNSYITPGATQGLAPHYDDVDVFVCQTGGTKRWFVYDMEAGGLAGHLSTKSSPDLDAEHLPKPLLDVQLHPGDVLYMPRGTVHQAQACPTGSSHLTLSAYQRWNYGTLATTLLTCMADNMPLGMASHVPCVLPTELRRGLPVGWLFGAGMQVCWRFFLESVYNDNCHRLPCKQPGGLLCRLQPPQSATKRGRRKRPPVRVAPVLAPRQQLQGWQRGCGRLLRRWRGNPSCWTWRRMPWRLTCGDTARRPTPSSSTTRCATNGFLL